MTRPPTIYSLAADLGVHASTVSRAFSRPELITPEIRDRVLARAAEVGYRPNQAARSLVTGRNAAIGLVLPDIENPFFPPLVRATQAASSGAGRRVILSDGEMRPDRELELSAELAEHVDGLLIASPLNTPAALREATGGTPVVLINRRSSGFSSVIVDNSAALRDAAQELTARGHRRIAFLGGPDDSWTAARRATAIRRWSSSDADVVQVGGFDASYDGGRRAAEALAHSGATAGIAFDDLMACGVLAGLAEHGISVPRDFSLIGCDDVLISRVLTPPLTTIAAPIEELGRLAVETLDELITTPDRPSRSRTLRGALVVRASIGPPPRRLRTFLS
ncbi:LacI family DNA-binding transcriptional regulator [Microlunatus soli]|uniref:Transcriptional regulator, LacI family n=1 Tax=Microlunatus soli TaxID=630515 RepID=A0A1H1X5F1_9ACTN|nr:LacI family DNA-binding transcriptional regulator [Microlunatus soli]SDT04291.1 transcriptional regulator, LacI family [Microlunatus soli]